MGKYRHFTWFDRLILEKHFNAGASYRKLATLLGFSVAAVYKEVQRGLYGHLDGSTWTYHWRYSAQIADDDAAWRATGKGAPVKLGKHHAYAQNVAARICAGESPDAIVGDLHRKGEWTVSTSTLYRYIDNGYIPGVTNKNLSLKSRRKRGYRPVRRAAKAPNGLSIAQRPAAVADRVDFGHWEMDTVVGKSRGKGQAVLVLTERVTRFEYIFKLSAKTADCVTRSVSRLLSKLPVGAVKSITVDNGSEFVSCGKTLPVPVYYCHPYSSWERGSNENNNRLIRRFFPKGHSLADKTQRDCDAVAQYMNHMHRRVLGYATAAELFEAQLALL